MGAHNMNVAEFNKERDMQIKAQQTSKLQEKAAEQAQKGVSDRVTANNIGSVKQASQLLFDMAKPENVPTFLKVAGSDVTPGGRTDQAAQAQLDTLRSEMGKVSMGGQPGEQTLREFKETQPKVGGLASGTRWKNYVDERLNWIEGQAQAQNKAFREASGKGYDVHPEWEPGGELWKKRRELKQQNEAAGPGIN